MSIGNRRGSCMKGKVSLLVFLMMLALSMQASTGLLRRATAQVRSDGLKLQASRADGPFAVIVELEGEPVAVHQRLTERNPPRGGDFAASCAGAYESIREGERADFKARAALISPSLRVRSELHKLANAGSIEVSETDI